MSPEEAGLKRYDMMSFDKVPPIKCSLRNGSRWAANIRTDDIINNDAHLPIKYLWYAVVQRAVGGFSPAYRGLIPTVKYIEVTQYKN